MMTTTTDQLDRVLSPEHVEILSEASRFAEHELHPLQVQMDDEEWWPVEAFASLGRHGYLGVTAPRDLGGSGLDFLASALVTQAIARWNPAIALSFIAHENLCLHNILLNASDEQIQRYVPRLCSGAEVGALALTEPGAGSDALGGMRTSARRDGDVYLLNGTKLFITNGPVADVLLVYAKTRPDDGAHGISAFIVESNMPGFSVAQKLSKMGLRGSPTGELVFEDCRVPASNLVGEEDRGVRVVMNGLDLERVIVAFLCLGIAERAVELSIAYAKDRRQFGHTIGEFQLVQGVLADMYASLEAMRSFAYRLGGSIDSPSAAESRHRDAAALALFAGRSLTTIADSAVQLHGGAGYIWEMEINRLYRAAKLFEIGAGTTQIRQLIVGEELMGLKRRRQAANS
jgi:isovaleryl-CoA dehydrogenase